MGRGKTVAFQAEHGKKAELPCPKRKQKKAEDKLGYLSTQTWIMDRGNLVGGGCRESKVCR
jgi:hypothetical protein